MAQRVIDRPVLGGTRRQMSYEEWRAWDYEGPKSEWVAGEAIVHMSTTVFHFRLFGFLHTLLNLFVRHTQLGEVFGETIEMHLEDRGRLPDVMFVRAERADRVTRRRIDGPADLAIELVSDDSVERDYEEKFKEYEAAGVREYRVFDARDNVPTRRPPAFYRLVGHSYQPIPLDTEGRLWSTTIDRFWLRPEWLDSVPLPDPIDCLIEIAPDYLAAKQQRARARQAQADREPGGE